MSRVWRSSVTVPHGCGNPVWACPVRAIEVWASSLAARPERAGLVILASTGAPVTEPATVSVTSDRRPPGGSSGQCRLIAEGGVGHLDLGNCDRSVPDQVVADGGEDDVSVHSDSHRRPQQPVGGNHPGQVRQCPKADRFDRRRSRPRPPPRSGPTGPARPGPAPRWPQIPACGRSPARWRFQSQDPPPWQGLSAAAATRSITVWPSSPPEKVPLAVGDPSTTTPAPTPVEIVT